MSIPTDDEFRTIGLPRGAVREILKGVQPPKPKAPDRPAFDPRGPEADELPPRRAPVTPPGRPVGSSSDRDGEEGFGHELLATVPPPGGGRAGREASPSSSSRPPEVERPRPTAGPASGAARPVPPPVSLAPSRDPRSEPSPSPAIGRSLDDSDPDLSTSALPRFHARPGQGPRQGLPAQPESDVVGVPFEQTSAASARPPAPASLRRADEPGMTQTPPQFVDSVAPREPQVRPARPAGKPVPRQPVDPEDRSERTVAGVLPSSPASGTRSTLQFFHSANGRWSDLGEVGRGGKVLGRSTFQEWDHNPQGLAEEHLEIGYEGDELYAEPLVTLNGVYRRLHPLRREELAPHTRFRIGRHVLEFRPAGPPAEIPPLRASDGEIFQARVLAPLGFIDLIGPDGRPYLSFPVSRSDDRGTRIGRAGAECDIALAGDEWVSLRHARVSLGDGKWWIEDLESTNGTYLVISGRIPLRRGTAGHPADGDELLVGGYKIRVIEEKA